MTPHGSACRMKQKPFCEKTQFLSLLHFRGVPLSKVDIKLMDIETNHLGKVFKGSYQFLNKYLLKNDYEFEVLHHIDSIYMKKGYKKERQEARAKEEQL